MDTCLLRIFLTLSVFISSVLSQNCEQVHFQRCMEQLIRFVGKEDLIFALTEQELKQQCVQAQSALGCTTRYIKKCAIGLEERKELSDSVLGIQKVTNGLCSEESDLRSRYLQSLPCLQNASDGIRFCQEKYRRNQQDIQLVEYEDKTPLYCCSYDGYRRCLKMLLMLHEECREGPSEVVDEIMHRAAGVLGEGVCEEYMDRCTGTNTGKTLSSISFYVIAVLFLLSRTFLRNYL